MLLSYRSGVDEAGFRTRRAEMERAAVVKWGVKMMAMRTVIVNMGVV
jgi:hypothetical protein